MSRWIRFLIAILVGIGLGLLYGWVISPVEYVNTTPDTLRIDFKTDYVLMVAEAYQSDGNLPLAVRRLALLGEAPPNDLAYQAIIFAQKIGYADDDLTLMQNLLNALQTYPIDQGTPQP
ncbi:MAG: hypothetical protein AB1894_14155 [Chloroflexota bacterium]